MVTYRPWVWTADAWQQRYADGRFSYFGGLDELARYSILIGYLGYFGGRPRILDVGCGPGLLRARLGPVEFAGYLGIDPTPAAVEQARALEDDRTRFVVGDPLTADLGTFDAVVLNEVLSIVPEPARVVERVGELLAPGGRVLTSIWRHPGDRQLWRLLDRRFELIDAVTVQNPANPIALDGWRMACHGAPPQ